MLRKPNEPSPQTLVAMLRHLYILIFISNISIGQVTLNYITSPFSFFEHDIIDLAGILSISYKSKLVSDKKNRVNESYVLLKDIDDRHAQRKSKGDLNIDYVKLKSGQFVRVGYYKNEYGKLDSSLVKFNDKNQLLCYDKTCFEYDSIGRVKIKKEQDYLNADKKLITLYFYNDKNNITRREFWTQIGDSIKLNNFTVSVNYINDFELTTQLIMDNRNMSGNQKIVISEDRMSVTVYNFNYDILVDIEEYTLIKHSH